MSDPLSEYNSEELLNALGKRYTCYIFAGSQPKGRSSSDMTFSTVGHIHECIGLAELAKQMIALGGPDK